MSFSSHDFASYVRVLRSIGMPTSTVKHLSGPLQGKKTGSNSPVLFTPLTQFSKLKASRFGFVVCLLILTTHANIYAQTLRASITVTSLAPAKIRINAEAPSATNTLSFRNAYGGVLGLGERIEKLEARGPSGETIPVQKLAPGEFQAAQKFTRFSYDVDVAGPSLPAQMSHVSWLNRDQGLLMLADLLPQSTRDSVNFSSARIQLDVPPVWTIASNVKSEGYQYVSEDSDKAVFLIGPLVHQKTRQLVSTNFSIITSGKWPISDDAAMKMAGRIIEQYSQVTGFELKRSSVLMLIPYPGEPGPEIWSAETRDNAVVLLLGRNARSKNVLDRLGIVLSHELFHLWVPSSLKLEGEYDWFFEGFTLYEALKMDLRLGLISFQDYLDTIARVYDSYLASVDHDRLSLLEAAERRWTTSSSLVYDKGMLVAFIYDLMLRNLSQCKASVDDVYKQLFRLAPTGQGSANETIIRLLSEHEGMESFANIYVQGVGSINLESVLSPNGFQVQRKAQTRATKLTVGGDLTKAQRNLLSCLGYRR